MRRRPGIERSIDLRRAVPDPELEVLEIVPGATPPPPPLRLFADLPGPREAEYAPPRRDPLSLAGLWRALESL
jgi:hypothetical protein